MSTRTFSHGWSAGGAWATRLLSIACAFAIALTTALVISPLLGVSPSQQAQAEQTAETPMWTYVGQLTFAPDSLERGDNQEWTMSYTSTSRTVRERIFTFRDEIEYAGWEAYANWTQPSSVPLGSESQISLSVSCGYAGYWCNPEVCVPGYDNPDPQPSSEVYAHVEYGIYNPNGDPSTLRTYETDRGLHYTGGALFFPEYSKISALSSSFIDSSGNFDFSIVGDGGESGSQSWNIHCEEDFRVIRQYLENPEEELIGLSNNVNVANTYGLEPDQIAFGMAVTVGSGYLDSVDTVYFFSYIPGQASASTSQQSQEEEQSQQEVVVETEATEETGESGGWIIPAAIVTGVVAVVGGAVALGRRGKKGGSDSPSDQDDGQQEDEPQKPSTYRMLLWKDCGDTLYVGGTSRTVGARIEEVKPDGTVVQRDDLTGQIAFSVSDNIAAKAIGMKGPHQCVEVQATSDEAPTGVISIKFTGAGGSFTNNVTFKVEPLEIVFPDVPLTFVAGKKQTFQMPFRFSQEDIAANGNPEFKVKLTGARANDNFTGARVVKDPQFPDRLFTVELVECGSVTKDDVPGTMEDYVCEVETTLPSLTGGRETTIRGQFNFFRFHEGLRFTCEPLKCYLVKHVENDDVYVSGDEMLDAAMDAQAKAIGLAGGMVAGVGARAALRENARDLKERFPELYREDDPYLYDKRNKVMLTPGRTHAYATLYVVESFPGPDGRTFQRPCTPLPKRDDVQLAFADVPGTNVLKNKDGSDSPGPVEELDFVSFVSDIKRTDNTVTFEILPTKGVMTPPNRAQVDVTCVVTYTSGSGEERTFVETQRVNAISQPYRMDYEEKFKEYQQADDEIQDMLRRIQAKIMNSKRYRGGVAVQGSVSLGETAADMAESFIDHPVLAFNPITSPGLALYALYKSITKQRAATVYYDDLMPIVYRIESMIEGHDYAFGFFGPEVEQIVTTFARFETGELGSTEAVDLAYYGRDMMFADALRMTVQDWNHSWTAIIARITFAFITFGQSEWLYMPLSAIGAGLEGSLNYIDQGGDDLLEAYRVGCSAAGKQMLFEGAMAVGIGAAVKCVKWAGVLTKEALQQRQLYAKALSEMFSSAKYSKAVLSAANAVETTITKASSLAQTTMNVALKPFRAATNALKGQLVDAMSKADDVIRAYRGGATVGSESVEREIAYVLGRMEGSVKVDALKQLMKSGGKGMSVYEKRAVAIAIQSDKHAMRTLLEAGDTEAIAYFNRIMGEIEEHAIQKTREALYSRFGGKVPMDKIRVKGTSGNAASEVMAGRKLPMDLDVTFEYWDDVAGAYKDVRAAIGQECFDREFYRIVKGYAAETDDVARMFARNADMTVTDAFHAEAYSNEYRDALRVIDKNLAGEQFTNAAQVGKVAEYKCAEWLNLSKRALADSRAARAAGDIAKAQGLAAFSEACAEEGMRQFTKQADRLVVNRLSYLYSKGIKPQTSVNIDAFLSKVAVLKRSGMGRFGGTGLTAGEVDAVLEGGFQTNAAELYHELNTLTVELSNALNAVK